MVAGAPPIAPPVQVDRWPTGRALLALVVLAAMAMGDRIALKSAPARAAGAAVALPVALPFGAAVAFVGTLGPKFMENVRQQQRLAAIRASPAAGRLEFIGVRFAARIWLEKNGVQR